MCRNLYEQATAKDIRADRRKKVSQVKNRNTPAYLLQTAVSQTHVFG